MAIRVFSDIFLHLVWHTARSLPLLDARLKPFVYAHIRNKCKATKGAYFHGIGGTNDHVHVVVRVEPLVYIPDFTQALKGASAFDANRQSQFKALQWQRGYGVVSFGRKNLPWILKYVENQEQHHARNSTFERLEETGDELKPLLTGRVREARARYPI